MLSAKRIKIKERVHVKWNFRLETIPFTMADIRRVKLKCINLTRQHI